MIVLTDTRAWASRLIPALGAAPAEADRPETWQDLSASHLTPAEQVVWQALGQNVPLSRCEFTPAAALSAWDYLVVIDDAPGSQFDILRQLDPARLPGSLACLAATGRGFHGHRGRAWEVQRGNLHLSTLCDPELDAARCGLAMTTLPAVAVMDTLAVRGPWPSPPGIKWVNDILLQGRKVAGVLTATQSERRRLTALTLGIGLNVAAAPAVPATPFVPAAGSLRDFSAAGTPPVLGALLADCLTAISHRLSATRRQGPDALVQAYIAGSLIVGRRVEIWPDTQDLETSGPPLAQGVVKAIGRDLSLVLEGCPDPIHTGRLVIPACN